jgi:hypothetical protein
MSFPRLFGPFSVTAAIPTDRLSYALFTPTMRALKLRNLPEIIKPAHITHILTRRGNPLAPPKDAGITM